METLTKKFFMPVSAVGFFHSYVIRYDAYKIEICIF